MSPPGRPKGESLSAQREGSPVNPPSRPTHETLGAHCEGSNIGGRLFLGLPAPAKLNLFLHVLGRRADGYHEIQSLFVPIDVADLLDFESLGDDRIERTGDLIGELDGDLAVRAARLLQLESGCTCGVSIHVEKRIPAGSGLGGGSSDAATTLIALNRLWRLNWPRERLLGLAPRLGADVAFFLGAGPALVEGVGERLTALAWPPCWYAVIFPQVAVSTSEIFAAPELTWSTKALKIPAFSAARDRTHSAEPESPPALFGANDLEPVARQRYREVDAALRHLERFGQARMTGSGSAVFASFARESDARDAIAGLPRGWQGFAVRGLAEHPLAAW
jgi:4-diphosphocytidyl-2-C-methyl-D-erythritol kinase